MILKLLEKLGRKSILVDFYGRVLMERYHILWYEDELVPKNWPNIWLHHFPGPDSPDGEDQHRHPWSTFSILLKGSYKEMVNREYVRKHRQSLFLSYLDRHRIVSVEPHTWTIFAHWFRRAPWTFNIIKCQQVCAACGETNSGVCFKKNEELSYEKQFARGDSAVKWMRVDETTESKLYRRRQAILKKGIEIPKSKAEGSYQMKKAVISEERS